MASLDLGSRSGSDWQNRIHLKPLRHQMLNRPTARTPRTLQRTTTRASGKNEPQFGRVLFRLPWFLAPAEAQVGLIAAPTPPSPPPVPPATTEVSAFDSPILSIAGGGRYFFWYLGVMKYLLDYFDLTKVTLIGASAGGLVAVLSACNVNLDRAVREAYRLSVENDVFTRPAGLAGIWGEIIREWLDELLPENAQELCANGRVKLVVTEALTLRLRYIDDFSDRDDLIAALRCTIHIPWFLDGAATRQYRGKRYIDGSLFDFILGTNSDLINCGGAATVVDYFFDDTLEFDRLDFVRLSSYEDVKALVKKGYAYAERTDAEGRWDEKLGAVRKGALRLAVEYPTRLLNRALAEA